MKEVNLISLVQAYKNLDQPIYKQYFDYFKINPKDSELEDLEILVLELELFDANINLYNRYFFGYTIPQISKEFDLLRFGENSIVNIELKKTSTEDRIKRQLIRNRYYLSFLGKNIFSFSFVSDSKILYTIDENDDLVKTDLGNLIKILESQKSASISNLDNLFNPSNYLVSPFNSTESFINDKYFLTNQQEEIKKNTSIEIETNKTTFLSIYGKAGTGKTLLTYDIAREYMSKGLRVLIVHCGKLNEGHYMLRDDYNWNIVAIKGIEYNKNISDYKLIIIDETQRINPTQLEYIIEAVKTGKRNCIFSYDKQQCLKGQEIKNDVEQIILQNASPKVFKLTEKIRTNKEIAWFITGLFDKNKSIPKLNSRNVELNYFQNYIDAKEFMEVLKIEGWKVINYTPSRIHNLPYDNIAIESENNAHDVIGQEFDNVVAVIDSYFYYKENNELSTRNYKDTPHYHPTKMLFQIVTRTRKKLNLIVINNSEVMDRCLSILQ